MKSYFLFLIPKRLQNLEFECVKAPSNLYWFNTELLAKLRGRRFQGTFTRLKFQILKLFGYIPCILSASINEPLRFELFSGYRNDRIHWHLQQGGEGTLFYRELYRDVEFWENGLTLKAIHRDLTFFLRGSYGTFGKGDVFQRYPNQTFATNQPQFQFQTDGWVADGSGYFGYGVNLTADRTYRFIATPLIGYSAHFEKLNRKDPTPNPLSSADAVGAYSYTMSSKLPQKLALSWYGFLFGLGVTIEPGNRIVVDSGYSYHLLDIKVKTQVENQVLLFNPDLISDQMTAFSLHPKASGNHGHTGWIQVDFLLPRLWRFGLGAQIHYFITNVLETKTYQTITSLLPSEPPSYSTLNQKFKLRWTSVSGWIEAAREF